MFVRDRNQKKIMIHEYKKLRTNSDAIVECIDLNCWSKRSRLILRACLSSEGVWSQGSNALHLHWVLTAWHLNVVCLLCLSLYRKFLPEDGSRHLLSYLPHYQSSWKHVIGLKTVISPDLGRFYLKISRGAPFCGKQEIDLTTGYRSTLRT